MLSMDFRTFLCMQYAVLCNETSCKALAVCKEGGIDCVLLMQIRHGAQWLLILILYLYSTMQGPLICMS